MCKGSLISIRQSEILKIQNVQRRDINIHIHISLKFWWPNMDAHVRVKMFVCLPKYTCSSRE